MGQVLGLLGGALPALRSLRWGAFINLDINSQNPLNWQYNTSNSNSACSNKSPVTPPKFKRVCVCHPHFSWTGTHCPRTGDVEAWINNEGVLLNNLAELATGNSSISGQFLTICQICQSLNLKKAQRASIFSLRGDKLLAALPLGHGLPSPEVVAVFLIPIQNKGF